MSLSRGVVDRNRIIRAYAIFLYLAAMATWFLGFIVLLTLRAWAVWHRPMFLTISLPILFTLVFGACFVLNIIFDQVLQSTSFFPASIVSVAYPSHPVSPVPFPQFPGCFVTEASSMVSVNYMLALAWDTRALKLYFEWSTVWLTDTSQVILILILIPAMRACLSLPTSPTWCSLICDFRLCGG